MRPDVKRSQEKLIELGLLPAGSADGVFGEVTLAAANKFLAMRQLDTIETPVTEEDVARLTRALFPASITPKGPHMDSVLANVKSAWASKINWTLAVGVIFNVLAFFGIAVPTDVKDAVLVVGNGLVLIIAWIIRTWFTTSITAASAKKL